MKRFVVACQIIVVALFIFKLTLLSGSLSLDSLPSLASLAPVGQAIAETTTRPPSAAGTVTPVKDVADDGLQKERELLGLLKEKQKDLDSRESRLKAEEVKLAALKTEIMGKIDELKSLEGRLAAKLEAESANDTKRLKELAKVYEASPPQRAATMMEKLDIKTAAGITINMKRDRAGLIWGYLNPQRAVEITNEITRTVR